MKVVIVGGGVSGLFCAHRLACSGIDVTLCEKENSIGKKLLVAGKSGLNITSDYPLEKFHEMYLDKKDVFKDIIKSYNSYHTRTWLSELGFESFVGSSYKVFPKEFKAASLLSKIKSDLSHLDNFELLTNCKLTDFDEKKLYFEDNSISFDKAIIALGGASWSNTGSDGKWKSLFLAKDITVNDFKPSNCNFRTSLITQGRFPLKNIGISFDGLSLKGESMIYDKGIEGGVIYHLSSYLRDSLNVKDSTVIKIDFLPDVSLEDLVNKLKPNSKQSWVNTIRKNIKLSKEVLDLIKSSMSKDEYFDPIIYSRKIKSFEVEILGTNDIDLAISTAGGVCLSELNNDFSMKKFNDIYLCGEMLDWEAPTGGFLIQGCFSMGDKICTSILDKKKQE